MRFISKDKNYVGELTTLPGCTQVVVSHSTFGKKRNFGGAIEANYQRLEFMEECGYDYALCTVDASNSIQRHILGQANWVYLSEFKSSKTGHVVLIFGRKLNPLE